MLKDQIINIIKGERAKGSTDDQIKVHLLGLGFTLADIEQYIKNSNNPNLSYRENLDLDEGDDKHHYLAPIVFFITITVLGFFANRVPDPLGSQYFIISILTVSIVCTIIFALVSFIIRKIAKRFGILWGTLIWVLIFIGLALFIWL
jgi:hypothetical protein